MESERIFSGSLTCHVQLYSCGVSTDLSNFQVFPAKIFALIISILVKVTIWVREADRLLINTSLSNYGIHIQVLLKESSQKRFLKVHRLFQKDQVDERSKEKGKGREKSRKISLKKSSDRKKDQKGRKHWLPFYWCCLGMTVLGFKVCMVYSLICSSLFLLAFWHGV